MGGRRSGWCFCCCGPYLTSRDSHGGMELSNCLIWFLSICVAASVGRPPFDCGEQRYIDASFVCDGDEDCYWGNDEAEELCNHNSVHPTGLPGGEAETDRRWLVKFLDDEYARVGGCGQPDVLPKFRQRRLVRGEEAVRGSWPWQTALVKRDVDLVYCGGTLIHSQWVLTAGHCIESLKSNISNLELWFGKDDVTISEVGSQKRQAAKIYRHVNHRYPSHKSNDIGLIKLAEPVVMAPYVRLACLPITVTLEALSGCYLAGWGRVSDPDEDVVYPANLYQLKFPMVPHDLCTSSAAWGPRISNKQICAGGDGVHDMCWGDSGGGLVCSKNGRFFVHGISSFTGHLCAAQMRPAIFTKVDRYLLWLGKMMQADS